MAMAKRIVRKRQSPDLASKARLKPPLEKEIGKQCDRLAETLGWTVERYEQGRATRIKEGLPDRRYLKNGARVWVELKRPKGKLTVAQYGWLISELDAGALATVVDNPDDLLLVLQACGRRSQETAAHALCHRLLDAVWKRGPRATSPLVPRKHKR